MNFDYHLHTTLSDGKHTHEEMVLSAIEKGFSEIGFSDHFLIKEYSELEVGIQVIRQMKEKIFETKKKYGNQIGILFGIEVDYFSDREDDIQKVLGQFNFDYIIGSVHFLDDWNFDTDKYRYGEFSNDFLYEWYFCELQKAAKSGMFDIIGHPDLIKKFNIWPETSMIQLYENTANIFAELGITFEINTSGKDRPCREFYPGFELLNAFKQANVSITLGSDSHKRTEIGRYFDEAQTIIKEIGYHEITRFENREKVMVLL